eukprot:scaffold4248_cov231-Pinguiococcus_pyrenoidosus.AAC.9
MIWYPAFGLTFKCSREYERLWTSVVSNIQHPTSRTRTLLRSQDGRPVSKELRSTQLDLPSHVTRLPFRASARILKTARSNVEDVSGELGSTRTYE